MNLDIILGDLQKLESRVAKNVTDEKEINAITSQFDKLYYNITFIQDELIDVQSAVSKLTY